MGKLFVIMGKSATGKDSLYQRIVEDFPELQEVVTYTTRPIRAGETYGKEYFFVSEEEMHEMQEDDKIIECRVYQTVHGPWYYFTANDGQINLEKGNYILITTLEGYCKLETFFGIEQVVPIYIEVDDFERIERALKREKGAEYAVRGRTVPPVSRRRRGLFGGKTGRDRHRHPCPE